MEYQGSPNLASYHMYLYQYAAYSTFLVTKWNLAAKQILHKFQE